ncbi:hypothetical protein LXJ15735_19670 [Lacrimispora xylanolytica]
MIFWNLATIRESENILNIKVSDSRSYLEMEAKKEGETSYAVVAFRQWINNYYFSDSDFSGVSCRKKID